MRTKAVLVSLILIVTLATSAQAQTSGPHQAGVVVVHGDGQLVTACIAFDEETITGVDLLRRSELDTTIGIYGGLGYGVCAIDGEGCAEGEDCFCQCRAEPCAYWVYSHREPEGSWTISGVGAATWELRDGDVDGWIWGDGTTAPPPVSFAEVCPPKAPEAVTATPVATPQRSQDPTDVPSAAVTATVVATRVTEEPVVQAEEVPATPAPRSTLPGNYFVFGGLALGLVALLVIGLQRRR